MAKARLVEKEYYRNRLPRDEDKARRVEIVLPHLRQTKRQRSADLADNDGREYLCRGKGQIRRKEKN